MTPAIQDPTSNTLWVSTHQFCCANMSSWLAVLFIQQQIIEFDDNVTKVSELHKVRGDDVDPVNPRPLSLNPGHDGRQISRARKMRDGD